MRAKVRPVHDPRPRSKKARRAVLRWADRRYLCRGNVRLARFLLGWT